MQKKYIGIMLMILTAFLFTSSTVLMKVIPQLTNLTPGQVGVWRFAIATPPLLVAILFRSPQKTRIPKGVWKYIGIGFVFALNSIFALFALERLQHSVFIIIVYMYPSLIVLYSLLAGKPVPRLYWLGLPMTLIGLLLVTIKFGESLILDPLGVLFTIITSLALGSYMVLSEIVFSNVKNKFLGTSYVMAGAMVFGLMMIPFMGFKLPDSALGWVLIVSFGIFSTLLPILSMNIGLQYIGAARGAVIITLQPVVSVVFSYFFLDEHLSIQQWLGGVLVVAAVILIQLSSDRKLKVGHQENN